MYEDSMFFSHYIVRIMLPSKENEVTEYLNQKASYVAVAA
jgi:hypothetical protein